MNESPQSGIGRVLSDAVPPLREPADRLGEVAARVRAARVRTGVLSAGALAAVVALALAVPGLLLDDPAGTPAGGPDSGVVYRGTVIVLESPEHGPRLCPAAYATPLVGGPRPPYPECAGPANEIVGWDWGQVEAESAEGRTWGTYLVEGTWDGERFTLTAPPRPGEPDTTWPGNRSVEDSDHSPCPEPPGGWRPVDLSKATNEALEELQAWGATVPEYAGVWLDQSYLDEIEPGPGESMDDLWNDPTRFVLNVKFVGDPAEWEPRIRSIWGGALCVSQADHGLAELTAAQNDLHTRYPHPAVLSSGQDIIGNAIRAEVLVATPELREELDQRYGPGVIDLEGWLEPVEP